MLRHLSKNEDERQATIDALEGLDTSHNDAIHNVLDLTCRLLQVPGCFICLYGSKKNLDQGKNQYRTAGYRF